MNAASMNELVWPTILGTALGLAVVGAARKGAFGRLRGVAARLLGRTPAPARA